MKRVREYGLRKDCKKCGKRRSVLKFGLNRTRKDGLRDWCKDCERSETKKRLVYYQRYRAVKRKQIDEYKRKAGCRRCRRERDPWVLQFHHPKNDKFKAISELYRGTWGWDSVLKEIKKCIVLCANCHIKLHRKRNRDQRRTSI